jgi:hypothetical protein
MREPFKWDNYSDQPALLKNRSYKKNMRKKELKSLIKTFFTALIVLPVSIILTPFSKRKEIDSKYFFSIGIDFEKDTKINNELIKELEIKNILLRTKLWEMEKLDSLDNFIQQHKDKHITLKILQDRENIEDLNLFKNNLIKIFEKFENLVDIFEIGTTINRSKWGFFSVNEYINFFKTAYNLKQERFNNIKIIGSGVIDFEYHFTAHTLFNLYKYRYDGISSLLYVDRRGAPENTQLGFSLSDKIALLNTMVWISPKTTNKLYITETNWPISDTAPYAPTSEYECVDEKSYANYMLRYYLLAFASQQVDCVSWHQLIAAGYGLVDSRDGYIKREAFYTYKYMYKNLKNAQFLRLDIKRNYYIMQCIVNNEVLQIHWSLNETTLKNEDYFDAYDKNGNLIDKEMLNISDSPIYLFIKEEAPLKINCI